MKKLLTVLVVIALSCMLVFAAYAAETVTVSGDMTLAKAISALDGKGGTIVIAEPVSSARGFTIPEQEGDLTITGEAITVGGNITLGKNTNDNTVIFDLPIKVKSGTVRIFGGFNSIKFTEKFTVEGSLEFFGGVNAMNAGTAACTDIPAWTENNKTCVTELPYSITVNGGSFDVFEGGNFRSDMTSLIGSIAAPIEITVNGGTFGRAVSFNADSALQLEQVFSVSGMGILADDATLTINGGTFNCPIYVLGYMGQTCTTAENNSQYVNSDKKFYAADGDIKININGGILNTFEVGAAQSAATYSQLLRGNYTVKVDSGAKLQSGIVFDATQVKAYEGGKTKAEIKYPSSMKVTVVRFDEVNGKAKKYDEPERFAFIGDSITQGSGAVDGSASNFEELAFPAQILTKMAELGEDVVVSNYGCGAAKVMDYGGLGYKMGLTYKLSMEETDADIIVIGLGTNDASSTSVTYSMSERFLEEYTSFAKGYACLPDTDMVYCTSAIFRVGTDVPAVSAIRALQEKGARALGAAGEKCTYVDLYALTLDEALDGFLLSSDNLHPHASGYTIYADKIYDAVRNGKTEVENLEMTDIYVSAKGSEKGAGTKEDPTSNISVAFAKAAEEATIHIIGEYNYTKVNNAEYGFQTPISVNKLTIVGEGEGAKLKVNCDNVFVNSDAVFDNIAIECTGTPTFILGFHSVEFTDSFKCDNAVLVAGTVTYASDKASYWYTAIEDADFDNDCVITVNGGNYSTILGGNVVSSKSRDSVFGTYSGNLTLNIGKGATVKSNARNGAVGQNYLTGSVIMNVGSWADGIAVREYASIGTGNAAKAYDASKNTGTVTVNILEGVNSKVAITGDFNGDGMVSLIDALMALSYSLENKNLRNAENFYGMANISSANAEYVFGMLAK